MHGTRIITPAVIALAIVLAASCAPNNMGDGRIGRLEDEVGTLKEFSSVSSSLDDVEHSLALIEDEPVARKETPPDTGGGGATSGDDADGATAAKEAESGSGPSMTASEVEAELTDICAKLDAAIKRCEAEIARLREELAAGMADAATGYVSLSSQLDLIEEDLQDWIDKEVQQKREGEGDPVTVPAECKAALAALNALQAQLDALAAEIARLPERS